MKALQAQIMLLYITYFIKYKLSLIQRVGMKDFPFNGESAFQYKGVLVIHQRCKIH